MKNLSIKNWAVEDRPIYKIINKGASYLSNAELLSILIGSGDRVCDAVELSRNILNKYDNSLNSLSKSSPNEITSFKGIGETKAAKILAAIEIGKRRQASAAIERKELDSATAIYNYMHPIMQDLSFEVAHVLLLNQNYKLLKDIRISSGGISETAVDIRIIMREAVINNATILVLVHNHPSGNNTPSSEDDKITQRVKAAADIMRIYFLDHVIITDGKFFSYRECGRI